MMNFLKNASLKTQFLVLLIIYIVSIPLLVTIYYHNTSEYLIAQKSNDNIDVTKIYKKTFGRNITILPRLCFMPAIVMPL